MLPCLTVIFGAAGYFFVQPHQHNFYSFCG